MYFLTSNATKIFQSPKGNISFLKTQILGGSWVGVYSTEDPILISFFRKTANVVEISEAEFNAQKKSLSKTIERISPSSPQSPPGPGDNPLVEHVVEVAERTDDSLDIRDVGNPPDILFDPNVKKKRKRRKG